ncbi:methyltransferase family protein [Propionibacteriaceae bacterium Y2011]|uniref:methyltransferase family protein n=1 Tax=Microlunatus sp. Y2014 TaxID=3418488 RepID=UPI003B48B263
MTSAQSSRPGTTTPRIPIPASPVLFVLAALAQRLIASRRTKRHDRSEAPVETGVTEPGTGQDKASDDQETTAADDFLITEAPPGRRRRILPRLLASVIAALSAVLIVTGVRTVTGAGTTLDPHAPEDSRALVAGGPFLLTRNPIYLGWIGLLVAHAVWLGSVRSLAPVGAFLLVMDQVQVPFEEEALRDRFGKAYEEYSARVPRWLLE